MLKSQYYINRLAEDLRECREEDTDPTSKISKRKSEFFDDCVRYLMYEKPYVHEGFSIEPMIERLKNMGISLGIGAGIRKGSEKLVNSDLLKSVPVISEHLKIPKSQARDVLSFYQRYLKSQPSIFKK